MSRIERKYCLINTSYLAELFDIFVLLHIWLLTNEDTYHKDEVMVIIRNLNLITVQSWSPYV